MTELEAQEMLAQLEKHYKEPVRRVSQYCAALEAWADAVYESSIRDAYSDFRKDAWVPYIDDIKISIRKSNLLDRLIYEGQKLRTQKCPEHEGRWSGVDGGPSMKHSHCEYGCGLTGWIPEDEDVERWMQRHFDFNKRNITDQDLEEALALETEKWPRAFRERWVAFYQAALKA